MQAHVDYTEVKPIPHQLTIQFINNFIINTTQFLNKFALTCDDKLRQVHNRIQRLEITMNILDAKLNSIEGMDSVSVASTTTSAPVTSTSSNIPAPASEYADAEEPEPVAVAGGMRNKDDPRYAPYFRLINVGVPLAQVQNKMMLEGVPPSILECVIFATWPTNRSSSILTQLFHFEFSYSGVPFWTNSWKIHRISFCCIPRILT
jgi:WASH complex subunit CCDC53